MRTAIYPGSFDPVTSGHLDIVRRAAQLFDHVVVSVLTNPAKQFTFSEDERVFMLREVTKKMPNVRVVCHEGLLVDLCEKEGTNIIVKGLRAVSDFEYEFQMALTNRILKPHIDTVFLTTTVAHMHLSSSMVRDVARFGGDISEFVPDEVGKFIFKKLSGVKGEAE